MTKYAVVKIGGRQYKVSEGEEIIVDKVVDLNPEILLVVDGDKVKIGKPKVPGAKIMLKKLEDLKGDKIDVLKYKAKSRYRKHIGFRPQLTKLIIEKIT